MNSVGFSTKKFERANCNCPNCGANFMLHEKDIFIYYITFSNLFYYCTCPGCFYDVQVDDIPMLVQNRLHKNPRAFRMWMPCCKKLQSYDKVTSEIRQRRWCFTLKNYTIYRCKCDTCGTTRKIDIYYYPRIVRNMIHNNSIQNNR